MHEGERYHSGQLSRSGPITLSPSSLPLNLLLPERDRRRQGGGEGGGGKGRGGGRGRGGGMEEREEVRKGGREDRHVN